MSTCFCGGKQILDAVIAPNEMVDELVARKEGNLCKLDVKKVYDHVC